MLTAAKESSAILTVDFKKGSFTPMGSDPKVRTLRDRLAAESYPGRSGKPTVVFFTAERAREVPKKYTKGKRPSAPRRTKASEASQKVYDTVFDSKNARAACIHTVYVTLVKTDISHVTKGQDRFLNSETAPVIAFYDTKGRLSGSIKGNLIGHSAYCREASKVLGNPVASRKLTLAVNDKLTSLESLVRKRCLVDRELGSKAAQVARRRGQKVAKTSRGGTSRGESTAEKMLKDLQGKRGGIVGEITEIKKEIVSLKVQPPAGPEY
jgi:hypothetical protein